MKVLIVCSGNYGNVSSFIAEQANSLLLEGVEIQYFLIKGKGIIGYIRNRKMMINKVNSFQPNLIHAHYGLSGLLANLQRKIPVITTYHGSDINNILPYYFSRVSIWLSKYNIFVSAKLAKKSKVKTKYLIQSCGVNLKNFTFINRVEARKSLGLKLEKKYVLFSSSFSNKVKNYPLAKEAVEQLISKGVYVELIELKGYSRPKVNLIMNAVDCVLVTSFKESGPLVIKEAMAVNTCAVSLDVGDVTEVMNGLSGYFIAKNDPESIADKINEAINFPRCTAGRDNINKFDNKLIAKTIINVYNSVLSNY